MKSLGFVFDFDFLIVNEQFALTWYLYEIVETVTIWAFVSSKMLISMKYFHFVDFIISNLHPKVNCWKTNQMFENVNFSFQKWATLTSYLLSSNLLVSILTLLCLFLVFRTFWCIILEMWIFYLSWQFIFWTNMAVPIYPTLSFSLQL